MAGKDYRPQGCCQGTAAGLVLGLVVLSWAAVAEAVVKAQLVAGWLF